MLLTALTLVSQVGEMDYSLPGEHPHSPQITETYDEFNNRTHLKLELGVVWSDSKNKLELNVFQSFDGKGRSNPIGLPGLMFVNTGNDGWRYLKHHPIIFLADGDRQEYEPKHDGDVERGYVLEYMWVHPSKDQFQELITAKDLRVRIGLDQFKLNASHSNAMKDFAFRVANPSIRISLSELSSSFQVLLY
jgi:hypothetical protein